MKTLDVGCGDFKRGDVGVDIRALPNVDFVVDLEQEPLPFADNMFDRVVSYQFLEHVSNPTAVLCEMVRVCKVGGVVHVEVPHRYSRGAKAKNIIHGFHKCVFDVTWFVLFAKRFGLRCDAKVVYNSFFGIMRPWHISAELLKL